MITKQQFVDGLRELADFYQELPQDFPLPSSLSGFPPILVFIKNKEHLAEIGSFEKKFTEGAYGFNALKKVGPWTFNFTAERETVCTRRVVGKKVTEEDIIEWDCHPVIRSDPEPHFSLSPAPKGTLIQGEQAAVCNFAAESIA